MFGSKKDMKGVLASFTSEAKAIATAQQDVANKKRVEISVAQAEFEAAVAEIKVADAFIANVEALVNTSVE